MHVEPGSVRMLVASPLGKVIEGPLLASRDFANAVVATNEKQVRRAIEQSLRFDVVLADLLWNDVDTWGSFDGLDVLDLLQQNNRLAPVVFAMQGHPGEQDHLDEAAAREGVGGTVHKSSGLDPILADALSVALGRRLPVRPSGARRPTTLYDYFSSGQTGSTAARMAGAIAARTVSNYESMVVRTGYAHNTVSKVVENYLGPLVKARNEHPDTLPLTIQSIYRWCGEHAAYIKSWCRRNGHSDVLRPG